VLEFKFSLVYCQATEQSFLVRQPCKIPVILFDIYYLEVLQLSLNLL